MVWSGGWRVSVEVSVCVSKEQRKKMKERKERREVGENECWGVELGGEHVGTKTI